ncbi:MAG: PTS sugar transporter subunit IIA [Candidatus Aminicenantes bacterium]|nr:PTS sugar transporter subunit IIA [Candidatus Aminicenantes bacterium]
MKLHDYLEPELIIVDCKESGTADILKEMVQGLKKTNKISNEDLVFKKLLEREKLGSTSIGSHAAVPHTKLKKIKEPIISLGISKQGIQYHENDKEPVHFIILILSPENSPIIHLQILAAAAALIKKSKKLIKEILKVDTAAGLIEIVKKYETLDDQE